MTAATDSPRRQASRPSDGDDPASIHLLDETLTLALRAPDAARALGVSERTLWTMTRAGEIPHARLGRVIVYPVDELREWLRDRARRSVRRRRPDPA